mmetsp:Transcript_122647/g.392640  ORF Transcript_122647/g.392640 Transcript_122647/m.392640 type:complete len:264 (+) Transcript_122647:2079-2870(+)
MLKSRLCEGTSPSSIETTRTSPMSLPTPPPLPHSSAPSAARARSARGPSARATGLPSKASSQVWRAARSASSGALSRRSASRKSAGGPTARLMLPHTSASCTRWRRASWSLAVLTFRERGQMRSPEERCRRVSSPQQLAPSNSTTSSGSVSTVAEASSSQSSPLPIAQEYFPSVPFTHLSSKTVTLTSRPPPGNSTSRSASRSPTGPPPTIETLSRLSESATAAASRAEAPAVRKPWGGGAIVSIGAGRLWEHGQVAVDPTAL